MRSGQFSKIVKGIFMQGEKFVIDEKTTIPIAWLIPGLIGMAGIISAGTFWVASVNGTLAINDKRLERIEHKIDLMTNVARNP